MKYYRVVLALVPLALAVAPLATADPVTWTFHNVNFTDGGTLQGTFKFDADNSSFSSINVITSAGTLFGGAVYTVDSNSSSDGLNFFTTLTGNLTGAHELGMNLTSLLSGTTADITFLAESTCSSSNCASAAVQRFGSVGGFITAESAASAPEPNFGLLLLLPLAAIAYRLKLSRK